jgi:hypothetical protein
MTKSDSLVLRARKAVVVTTEKDVNIEIRNKGSDQWNMSVHKLVRYRPEIIFSINNIYKLLGYAHACSLEYPIFQPTCPFNVNGASVGGAS